MEIYIIVLKEVKYKKSTFVLFLYLKELSFID